MNDEELERRLVAFEGWIDRWPWLSRYYTEWLLPRFGLSSAGGVLAVLALHVVLLIVVVLVVLLAIYVSKL